jgi:predicted Ser/Thr protein kinase
MSDKHNTVGPDPLEKAATGSWEPAKPPAPSDAAAPAAHSASADETGPPVRGAPSVSDAPAPASAAGREPPRELPNPFGRYRILQQLGKGAMGAVYLALDTQLDRQVALKIPFFTREDGPHLADRFRREARAMARLHHPNLCPVHDVGEIDGVQFLSMAYIDGRSLAEQMRAGFAPSDVELAALVEKLALALDSAHQAGIVHRDLKPSNIMIRPDGEPVIMDFGLARRHKEGEAELTHSGVILGTPAYMSPEQVEGRHSHVGPRTDVYALGVILYQLLAGRLPFEGSVGSVMTQIVRDPPPEPHALRPGVSLELEAICLKAMAKSAEQRYGSAREFAEDLRRFLSGGAVMATTADVRRAGKRRRGAGGPAARRGRIPRWAWVAGAGVLALAATVLLIIQRREQPRATTVGKQPGTPLAGSTELARTAVPAVTDPFTPRPDAPDQSWRLPPEPRRFPSLRDTISHLPPWLLADKDPPFDLARYFEVPVWEDNAAPLYLKALYEFTPDVVLCFPDSTRAKQYQVATDRSARFRMLHDAWEKDRPSVPDDQFDPVLEEFNTGFELLRQAQRKRECVFEVGAGMGALLPHAQACRAVANVEIHRARRDLNRVRIDEVIADVAMILRLARDVNHRGVAITFLIACAIDSVICDEVIRRILLHPALTKEQCARLIAILRERDRETDADLRRALQGEYVLHRVMLHDFQYRVGDFSRDRLQSFGVPVPKKGEPGTVGEVIVRLLTLLQTTDPSDDSVNKVRQAQRIDAMTDADYDREAAIVDDGFRSLLATCDRPVWERLRLASRIQDEFARNQDSRIVRYTRLPQTTVQAERRNRAQLAGMICLACLRLWQFDHAEPPTGLQDLLSAAGVNDLIADPYGKGTPFRFVLLDGQPVIYSLGADEYDDGGRKEWDLTPEGSGDFTFRLETIEALKQRRRAR